MTANRFPRPATDQAELLIRSRRRNPFGEYPDQLLILQRVTGCNVAADNVIVQDAFQIPSLLFGELRHMPAAVQALLFAGDGHKYQGRGEMQFAQYAGAFHADGDAAGVIVRAWRETASIFIAAVPRVVMPGHQVHAAGLRRIAAAQHRVNVIDDGRLRHPRSRLLRKGIALHLQAPAARRRIGAELRFNPVRRRQHPWPGGRSLSLLESVLRL